MKHQEIYDLIKVYKFDQLSLTLINGKYDYSDYLVVLYNKPQKMQGRLVKLWHEIEEIILPDTYEDYFMQRFCVERDFAKEMIKYFNSIVRTKCYGYLKATEIQEVYKEPRFFMEAKTDKGITLSEDGYPGRIWY